MVSIWLSYLTGLPQDQLRIIIGSLMCIPLSYILGDLKDSKIRLFFSTLLGTLLQLYVYGEHKLQLIIVYLISLAVYVYVKLGRRHCGRNVTAGSIIVLSTYHIYRMITDYGAWAVDTTTIFMMLICKYSSFAYACEDGLKQREILSQEQKTFRLAEIPPIHMYIAYIQFLPTAIMGPSLEYVEFQNYIEMRNQYAHVPNRLTQMRKSFIEALLHLALYLFVYSTFFPIDFLKTPEFLTYSWLKHILYIFLSVTFIRCKYYFAWKLSSTSVDASGLSYSGKNEKNEERWDEIQTCNAYEIETTVHIRDKIKNWNISVQLWLQRCIYYRYRSAEQYKTDKKAQATGQLLVFATSAFWHGFYGGYYISFFFWYIMTSISATVFRICKSRPDLEQKYDSMRPFSSIVMWIFVNVVFSYFGFGFQVLSIKYCLIIMSQIWFSIEILAIVLIVVLQNMFKPKKERVSSKEGIKQN